MAFWQGSVFVPLLVTILIVVLVAKRFRPGDHGTEINKALSNILQPLPPPDDIVSIRIYPIKSCRGIEVKSARLLRTGLDLDRNWMFVNADDGKFVTITRQTRSRQFHQPSSAMRLQIFAGALALAGPSIAFSDSSPLVLLSTSKFVGASASGSIQTGSQAVEGAKIILAGCPSDRYLLVSHPGVKSIDLVDGGATQCADSAMPHLCKAIENPHLRGKYIISEVVGTSTKEGLASYVKTACAGKKKDVIVEELSLPPVTLDRAGSLSNAASSLAKNFDDLASSDSYTLLYIGTPGEQTYEPEFDDRVRMDLKRDLRSSPMMRESKSAIDNRPLFEKYQFFTPGIFMALVTAIVLFSILGVGLRALASLEVSYGAFEKDMGPAAQKKQQ